MKKLITIVFVAFLVGCSSGGGGGSDSDSPTSPSTSSAPVISNYYMSPSSARVGDGGGLVDVTSYVDFSDSDGDVQQLQITGYSPNWQPVFTRTVDVTSITNNKTSGTLSSTGTVSTTGAVRGTYNYSLYLIDSQGNQSNTLQATFLIY